MVDRLTTEICDELDQQTSSSTQSLRDLALRVLGIRKFRLFVIRENYLVLKLCNSSDIYQGNDITTCVKKSMLKRLIYPHNQNSSIYSRFNTIFKCAPLAQSLGMGAKFPLFVSNEAMIALITS